MKTLIITIFFLSTNSPVDVHVEKFKSLEECQDARKTFVSKYTEMIKKSNGYKHGLVLNVYCANSSMNDPYNG